ncbi:MAG: RuBisCO large subunit C-terminal-like domain-containing protein [Balneolales bacterium]
MQPTFHVSYLLAIRKNETITGRIRDLQLEQSAELPDNLVASTGMEWVTGDVTHIEELDERHVLVRIDWPCHNHGNEITQFLNILFGNISLKSGIAIVDINWTPLFPDLFEGPSFGIQNIRNKWGIHGRALSCSAVKPMGHNVKHLSDCAYRFALGGIDIIKDDHGLASQDTAPFKVRVEQCVRAIDRAAQKTGHRSHYFPNITTDAYRLFERFEMAAELGADGVLIAPMLTGPAMLHHLARSPVDLPVMAHPAFSGTYIADGGDHQSIASTLSGSRHNITGDYHGFEAGLFYGALWRALGADFIIYPNAGGRFAYTAEACASINQNARSTDLPFPSAFPTPGGGMQQGQMASWLDTYGIDTTFLIGGSLYEHPDGIEAASRAFMKTIR